MELIKENVSPALGIESNMLKALPFANMKWWTMQPKVHS